MHRPDPRRTAADFSRRLGERLWTAVNPPEEVDPLALDLAMARRHQQLQANFRRVQRLLVIDESMSATRQIGNRLAYAWLSRELAQSAGASLAWSLGEDPVVGSDPFDGPGLIGSSTHAQPGRYAPKVEILQFGPRR